MWTFSTDFYIKVYLLIEFSNDHESWALEKSCFKAIICFPMFGRTVCQNGNCSVFGRTPKYDVRSTTTHDASDTLYVFKFFLCAERTYNCIYYFLGARYIRVGILLFKKNLMRAIFGCAFFSGIYGRSFFSWNWPLLWSKYSISPFVLV